MRKNPPLDGKNPTLAPSYAVDEPHPRLLSSPLLADAPGRAGTVVWGKDSERLTRVCALSVAARRIRRGRDPVALLFRVRRLKETE
jgi:hypothetical protein